MKQKQLSILELAILAQQAAINREQTVLENAVQAAEDQHYADVRQVEQNRHQAMIAAEQIYDKETQVVEKAWGKIFRKSLQDGFKSTRTESQTDQAAKRGSKNFENALPVLQAELPAMPELVEILDLIKQKLDADCVEAKSALDAAHKRSAKTDGGVIRKAKRTREQGIARAKRKLDRKKIRIEAAFEQARAACDTKLEAAKAQAQQIFDASSAARKSAWQNYAAMLEDAKTALLAALS